MSEVLLCNQCGAPLNIPVGTNYVTCNHCGAALAVTREASVTHTELVSKIEQHLKEVKQQQQLEQLDREWEMERQRIREGRQAAEPTSAGAVVAFIVVAGLAVVMTSVAMSVLANAGNPMFGILPLLLLLFLVFVFCIVAQSAKKEMAYREREAEYQRRRAELLQRMKDRTEG